MQTKIQGEQENHLDSKGEATLQKPKKKKDPLLHYTYGQIVACLLALVAVLTLKLVGGEMYSVLREEYILRFCDVTSVSQVLESFSVSDSSKNTVTQTIVPASKPMENYYNYGNSAEDAYVDKKEDRSDLMQTSLKTENSVQVMAMPVQGEMTSPFGWRIHPIYGTKSFHNGVDIGAQNGTPIVAALSGRVEAATYNDTYGYYIILDHSGDFRTIYAHCSELLVKQGDEVEKGDTIALVGSSGVSTGPHLHFEVRRGEFRINPAWLLELP
jgi:murein DD-endopeptidase MepM/ murein hydrolase activator NlpD